MGSLAWVVGPIIVGITALAMLEGGASTAPSHEPRLPDGYEYQSNDGFFSMSASFQSERQEPDGALTLNRDVAKPGDVVLIDLDAPAGEFSSRPYVLLERWNGRRWAFRYSLFIVDEAKGYAAEPWTKDRTPGPWLDVNHDYDRPAVVIPPVIPGRYRMSHPIQVWPRDGVIVDSFLSDHLTIE